MIIIPVHEYQLPDIGADKKTSGKNPDAGICSFPPYPFVTPGKKSIPGRACSPPAAVLLLISVVKAYKGA
jgi:hypothetical protein